MKVEHNPTNGLYLLRVPRQSIEEVAGLMAYRGLAFSTSASSRDEAVLFSDNPYALCDLAENLPILAPYRMNIEASRALNGVGTKKLPPGKELWDYQKASFDYVWRRGGGIVGDQPGLGKTPISLAFANALESMRTLVIVPASIRLQWAEKIKEWSTIPNVKVSVMLNVKDGIHPTAHYQVMSYDAARNPAIIKAIAKYKWKLLICDEAHKMKTADAITTRAILGNAKKEFHHGKDENGNPFKVPCISTYCEHHLALTGTLLLNRPSECLGASTQVLTNRGWQPIVQVRKSDLLWDGVEWVGHHGLLYQGCASTVSVGRISATKTHRFLGKSLWASAEEVRQNTALWRQILEKGSERLPLAAFPGIRAVQRWFSALATVEVKLKQRCKSYVRGLFSDAVLAEPRMGPKKPTQNTTQFARTLNYVRDCSVASKGYGTDAEIRRTKCLNTMGDEASGFFLRGKKIAAFFWYTLFLFKVTKYRVLNWIGLTTIGDTNPEISGSLAENRTKATSDRFPTFKENWTSLFKKSKCSKPVYDLVNAGPRQRFTILTCDGPVISHNCYVLLRHFDHESIDFLSEEKFKDRYNRQALIKTITGKRHNLESTSLERELNNRLRVNIMTRHEKGDVLKQMKPPRYEVIRLAETGAVKAALAEESLLGLSIDEIQTTKDIKILGHIAEVRRLMGIALAPQIADYVADTLDGSEEKICLFGWHIQVLDIFDEQLARYGTVRVDGRKTAIQRHKAVRDFIDNPDIRVFNANIQTGGTGVDGLQEVCSRLYIAEPDWVPAQNEQAVSRLDRIGQTETVTAGIFVAPGSVSEKIFVRALEKLNTIYHVMDKEGL